MAKDNQIVAELIVTGVDEFKAQLSGAGKASTEEKIQ